MTEKTRFGPTGLVGWLSVAQLISWGSLFYTFALVMEPVERELGLSRAQSSLAFSLALLAEGLMAFPVGRWIDRGHERMVMTTGSVLAGVCLALHGQVSSMAGFYAVWIGLGVAMACVLYSPGFAVVTRRFPHDFRRAIITMTFLGGLASTVAMIRSRVVFPAPLGPNSPVIPGPNSRSTESRARVSRNPLVIPARCTVGVIITNSSSGRGAAGG